MFIACKLRLTQGNETVDVALEKTTAGFFSDIVSYWGKFSSGVGNIPPERKIWLYSQGKWELALADGGGAGIGMGGGGLRYGELASLERSAILSRAILTSRGVEPADSSGIGAGEVKIASEISVRFRPGGMTWQLLAFRETGSSVWKNP